MFELVTRETLAEQGWQAKPFRFRGENEAALKAFLASDAQYAIARVSGQGMRQLVQKVAGVASKVKGPMGKRGKPTHTWSYPEGGFAKACETLGLAFENLTQGEGDSAVRAIGITKVAQ